MNNNNNNFLSQIKIAPAINSPVRKWHEQFTALKPSYSKRMPITIQVQNLGHFGNLAVCSTHVMNFKIVNQERDIYQT
jgi:hypothetical protein